MNPPEGPVRESTVQGVGRGNPVWLRREGAELRRPHGSVHSRNIEQHKSEQALNEEKRSTLSATAPEFFPKIMSSSHGTVQKSSVQDRIRVAREIPSNVQTPQIITEDPTSQQLYNIQDSHPKNCNNDGNTGYQGHQSYIDNKVKESGMDRENEDSNFSIIQYLVNIINTLTLNPAEFSNVVPPFVSTVRSDPGNLRCLQQIVTTIVEWSISETNFRYNGARLCTYLDTSADPDEQTLFRDVLYYTCKFETRIQELEWQRCKECPDHLQKRCHGLILFLAELVVQMDEAFAFTLGAILVQLIINILKKPASNSVKYICQALKLAVRTLERDKNRNKEMENMMRALTDLVTKGQVDTHIGHMVHSVRELRNEDWGKTASNCDTSRTQTVPAKERLQSSNEPVMYGPDGDILSAEESKFLQDHIEVVLDPNDQGILEEEFVDDEYDDEIATAYEEFLRDNSNKV